MIVPDFHLTEVATDRFLRFKNIVQSIACVIADKIKVSHMGNRKVGKDGTAQS